VDLPGAAKVCADMARVLDASDLPGLMLRLAGVLGSPGLIVWVADRSGQVLMPLLTHGYPAAAVARIGSLPTSAENATALAWRTGDVQIVPGALVAPIVTSDGCVGALAAELPEGSESRADVRALATIFAAQLATFVTALPSVGGESVVAEA
jgi:GAF domain-containing protein